MEYAFGGDPLGSSAEIIPFVKLMPTEGGGIETGFLTLDLRRRLGADEARLIVEASSELKAWSNEVSVPKLLRVINNGDGTETLTYRFEQPVTDTRRVFLRVRAVLGQ